MPNRRFTQWVPRLRPSQWRSGPAPAVGRFPSSGAPRKKHPPRPQQPAAPAPPIFDQLFPPGSIAPGPRSRDPDVAAARNMLEEGRDGAYADELGHDPDAAAANDMLDGEQDAADADEVERWIEGEEGDGSLPQEEAVLVVSNGSRSTLPSDFYRVAPRAEHLDGRGWSTMQATQARHPDTLDPLDKYILLFPTVHAAKAYKSELTRLVASPTPSEARLTLCPPDPASLTIQLVTGRNPLAHVPGAGVSSDVLQRGLDAKNIVHIKLEGSQLTLGEMAGLVRADGERRSLAWRLRKSWGKGGISISLRGFVPKRKAAVAEEREDEAVSRKPHPDDFFSWFFLSFASVHDARRFIREWHRRPVNVNDTGHKACIVNASLIW